MAGLIWMGMGAVVVIAGGIWALVRGQSGRDGDLGTISSQWMAEQRSHEREAGDR
jgi:hypothetical protein